MKYLYLILTVIWLGYFIAVLDGWEPRIGTIAISFLCVAIANLNLFLEELNN